MTNGESQLNGVNDPPSTRQSRGMKGRGPGIRRGGKLQVFDGKTMLL